MKRHREVTVGYRIFKCPPRIQRCDSDRMHGWQVRYLSTMFFSDGARGPLKSFHRAVRELKARYAEHPTEAPSSLRFSPLSHKQNDLPAGISGPVLQHRRGRAPYADFKVSLPVRGRKNLGRTVYIGTERTWSQQRYDAALVKAIKIRNAAVRAFRDSAALK